MSVKSLAMGIRLGYFWVQADESGQGWKLMIPCCNWEELTQAETKGVTNERSEAGNS